MNNTEYPIVIKPKKIINLLYVFVGFVIVYVTIHGVFFQPEVFLGANQKTYGFFDIVLVIVIFLLGFGGFLFGFLNLVNSKIILSEYNFIFIDSFRKQREYKYSEIVSYKERYYFTPKTYGEIILYTYDGKSFSIPAYGFDTKELIKRIKHKNTY